MAGVVLVAETQACEGTGALDAGSVDDRRGFVRVVWEGADGFADSRAHRGSGFDHLFHHRLVAAGEDVEFDGFELYVLVHVQIEEGPG